MVRFSIKRTEPQKVETIEEVPPKVENVSDTESNDAFAAAFDSSKRKEVAKPIIKPDEIFQAKKTEPINVPKPAVRPNYQEYRPPPYQPREIAEQRWHKHQHFMRAPSNRYAELNSRRRTHGRLQYRSHYGRDADYISHEEKTQRRYSSAFDW